MSPKKRPAKAEAPETQGTLFAVTPPTASESPARKATTKKVSSGKNEIDETAADTAATDTAATDTAAAATSPMDESTSVATSSGRKNRRKETAESMAARQRSISVSEFFTKNRHLLGFDNPRKALLTAIKEGVDNSLDACEEAGILPDILVELEDRGEGRFVMVVEDNGPGIVKKQIPNIFGKLLYGSKFHRLKMSRGQQGIGISAAGMYGLLTTGKPVEIISRTSPRRPAHRFELLMDTKKNKPEVITDEEHDWDRPHGTRVAIELEGRFQRGRQSVDEYLRETAIVNPHVTLRYRAPDGEYSEYLRATEELPPQTDEIKPHPYGVELGILQGMLKETRARSLSAFLNQEFSRVSPKVADEICETAGLSPKAYPIRVSRGGVEQLMRGISETKIMKPPTNCVAPIGEEQLVAGLASVVPAEFYASTTRPPRVYRGNPFIIEAALAYGGKEQSGDSPARLLRYANRVPLLYQQGGCCCFTSAAKVNWRGYSLQQPRGTLPTAPLTVVVHMASVWVPFTSESKEAIAAYPEIDDEITRALQECGRKLKIYLSRRRKSAEADRKRSYIDTYLPHIGVGLRDLLDLSKEQEGQIIETLTELLERRE